MLNGIALYLKNIILLFSRLSFLMDTIINHKYITTLHDIMNRLQSIATDLNCDDNK